jgi:hypothetical protein
VIALFGGPLSRVERAALIVGLLVSAALMWPLRNEISDRTYIWLHIARHLADGAGMVFNPGERVYSMTNPLWLTLLADGIWLGLDGLTVARVLGAVSTLLTVPLFLQLMRRTVRTPAFRAFATVAWAAHAGMAKWSMSGYETPLAVALVLGGFVALSEGADWGERPVRTGALWALAAITRPGVVLLLALWGTALLIDAKSRPGLRRLVFGLAAPVAIYGSWLLFVRLYFGTFWPTLLSSQVSVNPSLGEWWHRLTMDFGSVAGTEAVIVLIGVVAVVFARLPIHRERWSLRALPVAWVLLLPALFAARGLEVELRQLMIVVPVGQWLAWWAVDRRWGDDDSPSPAGVRGVVLGLLIAAAIIAQNLWVYRHDVVPEAKRHQEMMERTLIRWGHWFGSHERPGTLVASTMPGALAYFGKVRILDLNGQFTPALGESLKHTPRAEIVAGLKFADIGKARYLVDHEMPVDSLLARSPYREALEPLDEAQSLALYRIHWSKVKRRNDSGR